MITVLVHYRAVALLATSVEDKARSLGVISDKPSLLFTFASVTCK
jgi:hypothetical protein